MTGSRPGRSVSKQPMYVARRCPADFYVWRLFDGPPPESFYEQFRASIIEALRAMGVWLPASSAVSRPAGDAA